MGYFLLGMLFGVLMLFAFYLTARQERNEEEENKERIEHECSVILNFLHILIDGVSQGLPQNQLYHLILHGSLMSTEGMSACFYEYDPKTKKLATAAHEGLFPPLKTLISDNLSRCEKLTIINNGEVFNANEGIFEEVIKRRKPLIIDDIRKANFILHEDASLRIKSLILSPIYFRDEFFGILAITNTINNQCFPQNICQLLQTISEQAGIILHNARYLNFQREKNKIDFDLNLARNVQSMLFKNLHDFNFKHCAIDVFYKPAQQIGGDLYDVIKLDDHRTAFIVADVSGKGIAASLLMTICLTHLQHFATPDSKPIDVLKNLNQHLYNETRSDMFVTMIYAILDSQAKTLTIARAGHEYPLIISNDTQKPIESLKSKGMALGMVDNNIFDAVIEEKTYPLQDGDMCLLFTDGITEALNEREEEFSLINLLKFVQQYRTCEPHDFLEKLSNSTHKFVGKQLPSDDVTLLAFKIK